VTYKDIHKKYGERALKVLRAIAEDVRKKTGLTVEDPADWSIDEFHWGMDVKYGKGEEDRIDVTLHVCESNSSDGSKGGVTFRIDAVDYGGELVGGFSPYNYTEEVWVPRRDEQAVEERFKLFEEHGISGWPETIKDFLELRRSA
jgi:hypothetical protein